MAVALAAPQVAPHGRIEAAVAAALAAPQVAPHGRTEAPVVAPVAAAADTDHHVYDSTSTTVTRTDATPIMTARTVLTLPPTSAIREWPVTRTTRRMQRSTI